MCEISFKWIFGDLFKKFFDNIWIFNNLFLKKNILNTYIEYGPGYGQGYTHSY